MIIKILEVQWNFLALLQVLRVKGDDSRVEINMSVDEIREIDLDISLSRKGNGEAFARLIRSHKVSMYRIARSILKSESDIEDAMSEAILKAYINIKTLKRSENFKAWLMRILVNQCYDILRKNNREIAMEELEEAKGTYNDSYTNFELIKAINTLEEKQRIVTILFYYEDMSLKDISRVLNIPEGTVKSRLSRAKQKLESILKD